MITYLGDNIKLLGGNISSHNIYCRRCKERQGGGFDPDYGIMVCANEMRDQSHLEDTMAHEMVHAYDHLRFKMNWDSLRHAACSEVLFFLLGDCDYGLTRDLRVLDPSKFVERRVSLGSRIFLERTMEAYTAASGMRQAKSYAFVDGPAELQKRRTRDKGGE